MTRTRAYTLACFLGAFLLFQVQPMTSKALLPGFGGSYLVWGACMVFYQGMLLLGYLYAHAVQRRLGVARYGRWHLAVLLLPLLFFPFRFHSLGEGAPGVPLALAVFLRLLVAVSGPFLVVSTTSLVLQKWLSVSDLPSRTNPYFLYSASNLGSMAGLITYPFLVEPFLDLQTQGRLWWLAYAVLVLLHVACKPWRHGSGARSREEGGPAPCFSQRLGWFGLSAAACALLLACTNVVTFDVASVPFLWVLPLSVYLLTFVLTFKRKMWFPERLHGGLSWAVLLGVLLYLMAQLRLMPPAALSILLHMLILFVVALACAERLVRTRPESPRHLTTFYLTMALGGFGGSLLVGWGIPPISRSLVEYPLSLSLACLAVAFTSDTTREDGTRRVFDLAAAGIVTVGALTLLPWLGGRFLPRSGGPAMLLVACALPLALGLRRAARYRWGLVVVLVGVTVSTGWTEALAAGASGMFRLRNYYGIYKVYDRDGLRYLQHGTTQHGRQYLSGPKRTTPLAYFHPSTPAAEILQSPPRPIRRAGMVGLGTGALLSYLGEGQSCTVFELDPDNLRIARDSFSYLDIAEGKGAELSFVFGDGRLSLREEAPGSLDVLIIDAFNSGSIPVHLMTTDAFAEYMKALAPGGILLLHVSNRVLDLVPIVHANARALNVAACDKNNGTTLHPDAEYTEWALLTRDVDLARRLVADRGWRSGEGRQLPKPWTDRYSNVLAALFAK